MPTSQFTIYMSTDAGASGLTGQQGSLLNILNKCLVTGYGSQVPPSPAWTKPYTDSIGGVGCFLQGAGAGMGFSVDDSVVVTAKEARMSWYETLTSRSTGTNPFPTAALGVGGVPMWVCRKSNTADGTQRPWIVIADSSTVYVFVQTGDAANTYLAWGGGDFYSETPGDPWRCMHMGRSAENTAVLTRDNLDYLSITGTIGGAECIARPVSTSPGAIMISKHGDYVKGGGNSTLLGTVQYPNAANSALYLSPVWIMEPGTFTVRGRLRGFYHQCHATTNFTDKTTIAGAVDYVGHSFLFIKSSGNGGIYTIDTSNLVETN
jgi:hypothetical protein